MNKEMIEVEMQWFTLTYPSGQIIKKEIKYN